MNKLKLYFAVFAIHENNQWRAHKQYFIAKNIANAVNILAFKYKEIKLHVLEEVELKEGMFL